MTTLPELPPLDAVEFRRKLAGLVDNESTQTGDFKDSAAKLCFLMAKCFNRDVLDAKTLWDRIGSGIASSCSKVDDGDLDRFISLSLEHVKADHGRVASDDEATAIIGELTEQEEPWRVGFVRYLRTHLYVAIIHGRRMWQIYKETK